MNKLGFTAFFFFHLLSFFLSTEQGASPSLDTIKNTSATEPSVSNFDSLAFVNEIDNESWPQEANSAVLSPFTCEPNFYHTYANPGQLGIYDLANLTTFSNIGPGFGFNINATGYNPVDNFLYAINKSNFHLIRIHSDGSFDDLGDIGIGALATAVDPVVGGFDASGTYYVKEPNVNSIVVIDVNTPAIINTVTTAVNFFGKDWAYHHIQNQFYGVQGTDLYSYDPVAGTAAITTMTGLLPGEAPVSGVTFYAADGYIYTVYNQTGNLYRVDVVNSELHYVLTGPPSPGFYDGDSCPFAMPPVPVVCAHHDTICVPTAGTVVYDIHNNDDVNLTTLDFSSYTTLIPPTNGTLSYNNTNGEITYTATGTPQA